MPDHSSIITGIDRSPKIELKTAEGARAEIYLHGAHVTSWIPAGGSEQLFLSSMSGFTGNASIRGGIPVIFPQFANQGPLAKHGFVRRLPWEPLEIINGPLASSARLQLKSNPDTLVIWPHAFICELTIRINRQTLEVQLKIENSGNEIMNFTAALHTYFKVGDIQHVRINGLQNRAYIDSARANANGMQVEDDISFTDELDRIYHGAPQHVLLTDDQRQLTIEQQGFYDTVIWNPWIKNGAALNDLQPEGYRRFVCIEAAAIRPAVKLEAGENWVGIQRLTA